MIHVFLDASVLLAFSRSSTGASAYILECCEQGKLRGYISEKVITECNKNAAEDMGDKAVKSIQYVFQHKFLTIAADCSYEELKNAKQAFTNPKDAPIIASAKQIQQISHILSLDNGFFKPDVLEYAKPIKILKPGEFVNKFRSKLEK